MITLPASQESSSLFRTFLTRTPRITIPRLFLCRSKNRITFWQEEQQVKLDCFLLFSILPVNTNWTFGGPPVLPSAVAVATGDGAPAKRSPASIPCQGRQVHPRDREREREKPKGHSDHWLQFRLSICQLKGRWGGVKGNGDNGQT